MRCKVLFGCILAVVLIATAAPVRAQAAYAALEENPRFSVGGGFSAYDTDFGGKYMYGPTLWADWHPRFLDGFFLRNFSIEAQARDITWDEHTLGPTADFRETTAGGGLLYHARRFRFFGFDPYAKGLISFGGIHFGSTNPAVNALHPYDHDTRTVYSLGGGVDYRIAHRVTVRADYEYQWWPQFLGSNALTPNGFTVGALYNFGGHWR